VGGDSSDRISSQPVGYWVVRLVMGLAIAVLGGVELFAETDVSATVYLILASIAGAPEVVAARRK